MTGRAAARLVVVVMAALAARTIAWSAGAQSSRPLGLPPQGLGARAAAALPPSASLAPAAARGTAVVGTPMAQIVPAAAAGAVVAPAANDAHGAFAAGAEAAAAGSSAEQASVDGARVFDDAAVRGKSFVLVGTRHSRPFILEETVRVAGELGLKLYLVDKPESRADSAAVIPDDRFIAAPIDKRDDSTMRKIVEQIAAFAKQAKLDVIAAFRSHHAKLVGRLVDELKTTGVPKRAVVTADDKSKTREALNAVPAQEVPSRRVRSVAEARQMVRELGGRFVMKSKHGENSRFIEMPLATEDEVERAYRKMDAELRAYAKQAESSDTIFNRYPGIILERLLEPAPGTVEASVEVVVQDGKRKFAMVSDTHGIGPNGHLAGGAMVFPSQMAPAVQEALIEASVQALNIIGLKDGNARIDIMMTPQGPRVIEINPYLGGAAIWKAVKVVSGVSLVEWGIRALLNLALPAEPAAQRVVDYRFAAVPVSGVLEAVRGLDDAAKMPGVAHVQLLIPVGERVAAPTGNGFEEVLEVFGTGADGGAARRSSVAALGKIVLTIRKDDGTVVDVAADAFQPQN